MTSIAGRNGSRQRLGQLHVYHLANLLVQEAQFIMFQVFSCWSNVSENNSTAIMTQSMAIFMISEHLTKTAGKRRTETTC